MAHPARCREPRKVKQPSPEAAQHVAEKMAQLHPAQRFTYYACADHWHVCDLDKSENTQARIDLARQARIDASVRQFMEWEDNLIIHGNLSGPELQARLDRSQGALRRRRKILRQRGLLT